MDVIAIFDIGKTNKKILLFDDKLNVVFQEEQKFPTILDEDNFECDDIQLIENWIIDTLEKLSKDASYSIKGVNFSTYGATLAYLDRNGERLTPIYNYLKPIDSSIAENVYEVNGGKKEFSRVTGSPALDMLNSGLQIKWLKDHHATVFHQVENILHFPQYLSYILTGLITSEHTSIGCHTAMWNFEENRYHNWLAKEQITLPSPISATSTFDSKLPSVPNKIGIGIHDSSASLVPYLISENEPFMLISTGTWCINLNPFNHDPLTSEQLQKDCLNFMSIKQQPVKASRLFMGHIHDVNTILLTNHFNVSKSHFKAVKATEEQIQNSLKGSERIFFKSGIPENYIDNSVDLNQFNSFEESYTQLMIDLTLLCIESLELIISEKDKTKKIFISGGFARNEIFVRLIATHFPDKQVYTSEIDNASALGAALVIWETISQQNPNIELGLKEQKKYDQLSLVEA
ncbi:carbohydrate kinase [Prolixibacteraceae bacterium JC049]|nr:carbohydrate kinase [Prolixibacteraceae bacterium JC049]